jgi:hypothetical protein
MWPLFSFGHYPLAAWWRRAQSTMIASFSGGSSRILRTPQDG